LSAPQQLLVAGGGIGAMAAACAVARAGWQVRVFERTPVFAEVGAGLQLGPNVTRILHAWGQQDALRAVAAYPRRLVVRNAESGAELGELPLGERALQRYGAPYVTVHRADLHALLLALAQATGEVQIRLGQTLTRFQDDGAAVCVRTGGGSEVEGDALLGADGLLSAVRQQLLGDGPPQPVGDLAYRAMLRMDALPPAWHANEVTVWMGTDLHLVHYPVRAGAALNVVAILRHAAPRAPAGRDDDAVPSGELARALGGLGVVCAPLRELVEAATGASLNPQTWRRWVLAARAGRWGRRAGAWARGAAGRRGPPHAPLHGAGRRHGDRGRGRAGAVAGHDGGGRAHPPAPLCAGALAAWRGCRRAPCATARSFMPAGWCGGARRLDPPAGRARAGRALAVFALSRARPPGAAPKLGA
jgi:salicylate hydroxylase